MTTIEITYSGGVQRITVESVQYVRMCPYNGDHEFVTSDPRQFYCKTWHRVAFYQKLHSPEPLTDTLAAPPLKLAKSLR